MLEIPFADIVETNLQLAGVWASTSRRRFEVLSASPESAGDRSVFGGDVLESQIQDPFGNGGFIPGGWPNGRRFGDDVVDIAVSALLSDLRTLPLFLQVAGDNVNGNDTGYHKVMPYESTPQNGRTSGRELR